MACPATDWTGLAGRAVPCRRPAHRHGLCPEHGFGGPRPRLPPRLAPCRTLYEELAFHRPYSISAGGRAARAVQFARCTGTHRASGQRCQNRTTLPQCPACLFRHGLLIDVQRICPGVVELGLYTLKPVARNTPVVDMHMLEHHPAPTGRVSLPAAPGLELVRSGEAVTESEVDIRYGDNHFTAPHVFAVDGGRVFYDCTYVQGPITFSNTARRGETNAEIRDTRPLSMLPSCALFSLTDIEFGGSVVVDYGDDYIQGPPTPLQRHGLFLPLGRVTTLYRFSDKPVDAIGSAADARASAVDWPASLEQREVFDVDGLARFVARELSAPAAVRLH